MEYTLSYSEGVAGWVSFYSYYPDWIIGMNNYLYTLKVVIFTDIIQIELRNTFYQPWWTQLGHLQMLLLQQVFRVYLIIQLLKINYLKP
jgi:hypothetical protein